jgi:hypothetical protein
MDRHQNNLRRNGPTSDIRLLIISRPKPTKYLAKLAAVMHSNINLLIPRLDPTSLLKPLVGEHQATFLRV